jgi:hypothetical protein
MNTWKDKPESRKLYQGSHDARIQFLPTFTAKKARSAARARQDRMENDMTVAQYLSAVMAFAKQRALLDISYDLEHENIKLAASSARVKKTRSEKSN